MPSFLNHYDHPVQLKIISNEVGTVQVIIPKFEVNMTYLLTSTEAEIYLTYHDLRAIFDDFGIGYNGILITSTVQVAIYVIEGDTGAGFGTLMPVIPVINSAKEFVVQSYNTYWGGLKSHFIIVATEDSTNVNITLKIDLPSNVTYRDTIFKDGDVINVTLNRLETFYAYLADNDLSGSLIESNKPIAVFSGAICVEIPKDVEPCNIILSQMIPISQWGLVYIVPPIYPVRGHVRVFAYHNATNISIHSNFEIDSNITLNQGEFWETILYDSQAQPLVISSDTAISVVLYGASAGSLYGYRSNPFMLVVPNIHQYSTSATMFPALMYGDSIIYRYSYNNYAAIVSLDASFNQLPLQYNGITPVILQRYSLLNNYTVSIIALNNVNTHTISTVEGSTPIPMAVLVYGLGWRESYGFVAGFKIINAGNKT